jgi:L,D-peptidoglycan transpeptidase YkuD (ErfK/YbiS/YcfS/YnhG family)
MPCALGRSGVRVRKREGDGATPKGSFSILGAYFRADRTVRPITAFPLRATRGDDGWCDDPGSFRYNRPARLPFRFRCENMWLTDGVYDIVLVTNYNMHPRVRGAGSAIFIHLRRDGWKPTEGCVALDRADVRRLLPRLARQVKVIIG